MQFTTEQILNHYPKNKKPVSSLIHEGYISFKLNEEPKGFSVSINFKLHSAPDIVKKPAIEVLHSKKQLKRRTITEKNKNLDVFTLKSCFPNGYQLPCGKVLCREKLLSNKKSLYHFFNDALNELFGKDFNQTIDNKLNQKFEIKKQSKRTHIINKLIQKKERSLNAAY